MSDHIKANRRLIVLCLILVLLVIVLLNRWDIWWDIDRGIVYRQDKLTSEILTLAEVRRGLYIRYPHNVYFTNAATAILYVSIGGVVIALLNETKRN